VNVGGPTIGPKGAGLAAVEGMEGRRSGHSSQRQRKAAPGRRTAGIGEKLEGAEPAKEHSVEV
jgi:hypothetical protein